jgi:glycosyltransferase 2 family protein
MLFLWQLWVGSTVVREHGLQAFDLRYLGVALLSTLLLSLAQMVAWAVLMRYVGVAIPAKSVVEGYFVTFLPRHIPGTIWGYLSRGQWLNRDFGVSYRVSSLTSIVEMAALVFSATAISAVAAGADIGSRWRPGLLGMGFVSALLLCVALPVAAIKLVRGSKHEAPGRHPVSLWLQVICLYCGFWLVFGVGVLLTGRALGLPTADLHLRRTTYSAGLSWIAGTVAIFVPSGVGIREWSLGQLLEICCLVPVAQANLIAVVMRFELIVAELFWLAVALAMQVERKRRAPARGIDSTDDGCE